MDEELKIRSFEEELRGLINRYSKENESDTPDFILAQYLIGCLSTFNAAVKRRTDWYYDGRRFDPYRKVLVQSPCSEQKDSEVKEELYDGGYFNTSYAKCPYCGYENCDSWELGISGLGVIDNEGEADCDQCEKTFIWSRNISSTYSTVRKE